jgi:hypothetical protein
MYAVILQERTVVSSENFAVYLHCLYLKYHNYSVEVSRLAGYSSNENVAVSAGHQKAVMYISGPRVVLHKLKPEFLLISRIH